MGAAAGVVWAAAGFTVRLSASPPGDYRGMWLAQTESSAIDDSGKAISGSMASNGSVK